MSINYITTSPLKGKGAKPTKLGSYIETFLLEGSVVDRMKRSEYWPTAIHSFLLKDLILDAGAASSSAGGYRIAGRFIFFHHAQRPIDRISKILEGLVPNLGTDQENIMILTGITGGTGAGVSIDLAYLIRTILSQDFSLSSNQYNIQAYLVLPDVNQSVRKNSYCESNGYAYLKELDYSKNLVRNCPKSNLHQGKNLVDDANLYHPSTISFIDSFPLYIYHKLLKYEKTYETALENNDKSAQAMHLFSLKDGENWAELLILFLRRYGKII